MIGRIWRAYEELLRTEILPGITKRGIAGYRGAHLLRNDKEDEVEFVTICWFDAYDAVREFAGGERPENFWLVSMTIQPTTM